MDFKAVGQTAKNAVSDSSVLLLLNRQKKGGDKPRRSTEIFYIFVEIFLHFANAGICFARLLLPQMIIA